MRMEYWRLALQAAAVASRFDNQPDMVYRTNREVGGGRVPRQPGQDRKVAALTNRIRVVASLL